MPNIQAIHRTRHAQQRWHSAPSYAFAATDGVVALVAQELPKALLSLPIAFIAAEGSYLPVAVQNFKTGQNLFVAADGRWIGSYVPSAYRGYPFMLGQDSTGKQALCVDEDSGFVCAADDKTALAALAKTKATPEPFFGEDGEPTKKILDIFEFLNQVAKNRVDTQRLCTVLQKHALIEPWPVKVQGDSGEQNVDGLFRISEAALNQLPTDAFMELRSTGALLVAYCQLLSVQQLPMLAKLAQAHAQAAAQIAKQTKPLVKPSGDLDLEFLNNNGTISFGNLFK